MYFLQANSKEKLKEKSSTPESRTGPDDMTHLYPAKRKCNGDLLMKETYF